MEDSWEVLREMDNDLKQLIRFIEYKDIEHEFYDQYLAEVNEELKELKNIAESEGGIKQSHLTIHMIVNIRRMAKKAKERL